MDLLKNFDTDVSNKIKNNNIEYVAHYFKHRDSNTNFNSLNNIVSYDDIEIYSPKCLSSENLKMIRTTLTINNIKNKLKNNNKNINNEIGTLLNKLTFGCNHIFHDDKWLKFYKDNFICSVGDDIDYIYCNTFNRDDMHDINLNQFIKTLQDLDIDMKFVNFDENDEDMEEEYENNDVTWFVIMIKK
jgi:hypothetical protein